LKVTTFSTPLLNVSTDSIGIDFGIKDDLVLSNGVKFKTKLEISKRVKLDQRALSRKIKGSTNHFKQKNKLKKSYEKHNNKKKDAKNKIVNYLITNFGHIGIQDENIKGWHASLFGKQVQQSMMGGIISGLKKSPRTSVIDRYFPSTQLCPSCATLNKFSLSKRVYKCECGYEKDRDTHAASNILNESLKKSKIPAERRKLTPVEFNASALEKLRSDLSNSFVSID
jgi:transposase